MLDYSDLLMSNGIDWLQIFSLHIYFSKFINQNMSRLTAQTLRKLVPVFQMNTYRSTQDKKQYIQDLILVIIHKRKLNSSILCMNQLNDILQQIGIPLKIQQLHELYLYGTYQKFENASDTKKRLLAIVNQEKKKLDTNACATWINKQINSGNIRFTIPRTRAVSQYRVKPKKQIVVTHLPPLRGSTSEKLSEQLKYLISIFEEMQRQRQNSGLIPLNLESDQQEIELQCNSIPYDPQLYELNKNLSRLRIKAEDRLARIIELAKDDPGIRKKLEDAIERFQKARIQANQKMGRMGAMKAQKRLIASKKKEMNKFKNVQLGEDEDLVRAAHMHYLMSIQPIKPSKIVI